MPRINVHEKDPNRYAQIKMEQEQLDEQCSTYITMVRVCPYCNHKMELLFRGTHSASKQKCSACGEEVIFPPVTFRIA